MKTPFLTVALLLCCCIGLSMQRKCSGKAGFKDGLACSEGKLEAWRGREGKLRKLVCCDTPQDVEEEMAFERKWSKQCQTTNCLVNKDEQADPCSTIEQKTIGNETFVYDEMAQDKCTDGGNGKIFLCCPRKTDSYTIAALMAAENHEFPHMANVIGPDGFGLCGGTVYNKDYVLTAAHCVVDFEDKQFKPAKAVLLGTNLREIHDDTHLYEVEETIVHPDYGMWPNATMPYVGMIINDVTLLKLKRSIDFKANPNIRALQIAPEGFNPGEDGAEVAAAGWGKTDEGELSKLLLKSNLKIRTHEQCFTKTGKWAHSMDREEQYSERMFCIGGIVNGTYSAKTGQGDSGGPSICRDKDGNPVQCGITSFSVGGNDKCNKEQTEENCFPSFHVNVSHFHKWIVDRAGPQDPETFIKVKHYGEKVAQGEYEHQVRIKSKDGTSCGGTLVGQDIVVTAAHCVVDDNQKGRPGVKITAGGSDKEYGVKGVTMASGFKRNTEWDKLINPNWFQRIIHSPYFDDIAVIKLDKKVDISPNKLAKLPQAPQPTAGPAVELAYPQDTPQLGDSLMKRQFTVLEEKECQQRLERVNLIGVQSKFDMRKEFCGVEVYSGGGVCDREEGGALMCKNDKGEEEFCGVQTFRTCTFSIPSVFLNVNAYKDLVSKAMA